MLCSSMYTLCSPLCFMCGHPFPLISKFKPLVGGPKVTDLTTPIYHLYFALVLYGYPNLSAHVAILGSVLVGGMPDLST